MGAGFSMIRSNNKECYLKMILTTVILIAHIHYVPLMCQESC